MAKINLLSSKIYNRIAAGEVVERPASVVKELVENSLDAGATSISIEIENGGISCIKIIDNGCGIEKSELKKALMPHATSKISCLQDLDNILSLGFRGEALSSIASVSKITIVSKPHESELGASIYSEGGTIAEPIDCGATSGTEITVNNLFFNTPVREKFLKTARSEESEISSIVAKFILGNTNVSFKYSADGKTIYQSFGDGFESALVCIYGPQIVNDCFFIDTEKNGIKIKGYLGKHHFTKGNRTYQTVFLNNRFINNQTISSAVNNAYASYLMKRQYPFYVLSLSVPTEIVDVNVHPNKLDVRFANNQIIYGSIYSVVSKVLDGTSEVLNIISNNQQHESVSLSEQEKKYSNFEDKSLSNISSKKVITENLVFNNNILDNLPFDNINQKKENHSTVDIFAENKAFLEKLEREKQEKIISQEQQVIKINKELNYVGQALNTFLIFDDGEDMYLVDQHAAHERILFDKLIQSVKSSENLTQSLLIPFILNVNFDEFEFLIKQIPMLSNMGFEINEFGKNAFKISSIPAYLTDINIQKFFDEILDDLNVIKTISATDVLMEKLAQKACKSAIKSGDKLSQTDIEWLTTKLKDNLGLKCPHGRPVAIKITRTEIDKWFKRII